MRRRNALPDHRPTRTVALLQPRLPAPQVRRAQPTCTSTPYQPVLASDESAARREVPPQWAPRNGSCQNLRCCCRGVVTGSLLECTLKQRFVDGRGKRRRFLPRKLPRPRPAALDQLLPLVTVLRQPLQGVNVRAR